MFTEAFPIVTVPSIARILQFYVGLLGFRQTYAFPPTGEPAFVVLRLGTSDLGFGADPLAAPANEFELCIYADDCDTEVTRLRSSGVLVIEDPSDQPWGERAARVLDPAGNRVMIVSRNEQPKNDGQEQH